MNDLQVLRPGEAATLSPQSAAALAPAVLCALLERRYLTDFDHAAWRLETRPDDFSRPLLYEVLSLGQPESAQQGARAMQHVLTACHEPGHAFVSILQGEAGRVRLHIGARRAGDGGARSTEDYLDAQAGAFKAYLPGLDLAPARRMDNAEMPDLSRFLMSAPVLGAVTGVPANRLAAFGDPQNLERLVRAAGGHRYALMIVAEAVPNATIDQHIDQLRQLKSDVHALVRQTRSDTKGATRGVSRGEGHDPRALDMPMGIMGAGIAAQVLGAAGLGLVGLGGLAGPLQTLALMSRMKQADDPRKRQVSEGATWSEGVSVEVLDENARACETLIDRHLDRLNAARSSGWWQSAVYVAGESEAALHALFGALRSLYGGDAAAFDPIRAMRLPPADLRPAMQSGRLISMAPRDLEALSPAPPASMSFDMLATYVNSTELGIMACPPQQEVPGLPMRKRPPFALTAPLADMRGGESSDVALGALMDHFDRPIAGVGLSQRAINGHVFVSGIVGGGKTNTCMRLLIESYEKWGVPFLVVEPAKAEYRRLAAHPSLQNKLRVYSIGADSPLPLRLNPFTLRPGVPLLQHIDRLKAVFNASFPMFAGMSYILEEAILEIYEERGWSIHSSKNAFLSARATIEERAALTPSMEDLYEKVDVVLARRKYGQEIQQNMGAALRSRLKSLMVGSKGMILNTRRGTPMDDLFGQPTVIELQNLGDDEEKAFVMALIFVLLCEHAEMREADTGALHHITLVEEAHRLLTATRGGGAETADPRGKAVSMFTDMLAEMRALGEGFIIADQIPTKLAPEVLKNSNIKIIHRLVSPDDRHAVGQCANLNDAQIAHLTTLSRGVAVVHGDDIKDAVLVAVAPVKDALIGSAKARPAQPARREIRQLHRHAACEPCANPCKYFPILPEARPDHDALAPVFDRLLLNDGPNAWAAWQIWRAAQRRRIERALGRGAGEAGDEQGVKLCAVVHAAQTWLASVFEARNRLADEPAAMTPEQRLARERASKGMAVLGADWLKRSAFDHAAREAFAAAESALREAFAGCSPSDAPGCAACPDPCRMASFASGALETLRAPIARALSDESVGVLAKQAQIERALLQARRDSPGFEAARMPALLYCAVAQVSAKLPERREAAQTLLTEFAVKARVAEV